jgi:hypothetical protein
MKALFYAPWAAGVFWGIAFFAAQPLQSFAQTVTPQAAANDIRIEAIEGRVEVNAGGNTQWLPVQPGQGLKPGDRVRTREALKNQVGAGGLSSLSVCGAPPRLRLVSHASPRPLFVLAVALPNRRPGQHEGFPRLGSATALVNVLGPEGEVEPTPAPHPALLLAPERAP